MGQRVAGVDCQIRMGHQQPAAKHLCADDDAEARRRDYAESIGFQPYAATEDQSDPILEGMRILLDRIQQNEKRMNNLCNRLSLLDPTFNKQQQDGQPLSKKELEILEEARRECEAQTSQSKA